MRAPPQPKANGDGIGIGRVSVRGVGNSARDAAGQRVAIVHAARAQDQRIVSLDPAGTVVEHALRLQGEVAGCHQATCVRHLLRTQQGHALGGEGAASVVDLAVGIQRKFTGGKNLASRVVHARGADVGHAAVDAAVLVAQAAKDVQRQPVGRDVATFVEHVCGAQRGAPLGEQAAVRVVEASRDGKVQGTSAGELACGIDQATGIDADHAAVDAAALVAQRAHAGDRQRALGLQDAIAVIDIGRLQRDVATKQLAAPVVERAAAIDTGGVAGLDHAVLVVDAAGAADRHGTARHHAASPVDDDVAVQRHRLHAGDRATTVINGACHMAVEPATAGELAKRVVQAAGMQRDRCAI